MQRVEHGVVPDRADIVDALKEAGLDVSRQGKDYVTVHDPENGKRWRRRERCTSMTLTQSNLRSRFQHRLENEPVEIEAAVARQLVRTVEMIRQRGS